MVLAMVKGTPKMLKNLEQAVLTGADDLEVEVQQQMEDLTADVISCTAFGGSYERDKKVLEQLRNHQKPLTANHQILSMPGGLRFPDPSTMILSFFLNPYWA